MTESLTPSKRPRPTQRVSIVVWQATGKQTGQNSGSAVPMSSTDGMLDGVRLTRPWHSYNKFDVIEVIFSQSINSQIVTHYGVTTCRSPLYILITMPSAVLTALRYVQKSNVPFPGGPGGPTW